MLSNTLFVDILKDVGDELRIHTTEGTLGTTLVQNLIVTIGLKDGHIVLFLVLTNLTTNLHALGEQIHQLVVELVDLLTKLADALSSSLLITDHEQ